MELRIRYRDLSIKDPEYKSRILDAIGQVLDHGQILLGPEVEKFERAVADFIGVKHCIAVGSGTDAVYLALRSLGIGPGDEVITTPLSWIATANAIHFTGAKPVFVDIDEDLNIDASLIETAISPRTRAILPVHFTGRICNMPAIAAVAAKHNLWVIEDAAQAFGASLNGRYAGSLGHTCAFSMNPMKVLPAFGEVGAVASNNDNVAQFLKSLRYLGTVNRDTCISPSLNFKVDTIHAATLLVNLEYLESRIARRIQIADFYTKELGSVVLCPKVSSDPRNRSVFFDYTVRVERRDDLISYLKNRGIETRIKHPVLMPDQPGYGFLEYPKIPLAREVVKQILSLPAHELMLDGEVEFVVASIKDFYKQ